MKRLGFNNQNKSEDVIKAVKDQEKRICEKFKDKDRFNSADCYSFYFAILNRKLFFYRTQQIFTYYLKCYWCRNFKKNKHLRRVEKYNEHFLFQKAAKKVSQELDVIKILG